jgi:dehydrogenase/reductase SDR family member 7B
VQGKFGLPYRTAYSASKHALTGYFDALRAEVAQSDVRVTVAFPGYIKTNLSVSALKGMAAALKVVTHVLALLTVVSSGRL